MRKGINHFLCSFRIGENGKGQTYSKEDLGWTSEPQHCSGYKGPQEDCSPPSCSKQGLSRDQLRLLGPCPVRSWRLPRTETAQPVQCLTVLMEKTISLHSAGTSTFSIHDFSKDPDFSSCWPPCGHQGVAVRFPLSHPFPGLSKPCSPGLSSQGHHSSPWLSWRPPPTNSLQLTDVFSLLGAQNSNQ